MDTRQVIIWNDIETNTSVCSLAEAHQVMNHGGNSELACVYIESVDISLVKCLPDFCTSALTKDVYIILPGLKIRSINKFIYDNNLTSITSSIIWLASVINKETVEWENLIKNDSSFIQHDLKTVSTDKNKLQEVMSLYEKNYYPKSHIEATNGVEFISFGFFQGTFKITNNLLLQDILDCIRKHFNFDAVNSINFSKVATDFKENLSAKLLLFFTSVSEYGVKKKAKGHRIITGLFNLAIESTTEEQVKQWIARASTNRDTPE